jgi:glutaredoxin
MVTRQLDRGAVQSYAAVLPVPTPAASPPRASATPLVAAERPRTPEEQVADADRARVLREREPEDTGAQRAPSKAEIQRRAEADARDHERHEAVKQQLDAMSISAARRNVVIQMYSTSWCGVCELARDYMHQKNIAFSEFDIEQDDAARTQARALNPARTVPTISIDGDIMIGFTPKWLEWRIDRAAKVRTQR